MADIVLGTFFGDEGKGQAVHNLCKQYDDCIVIRFSGGHQVGHNVTYGSIKHCFSNFGSGTLLGHPTYWSEYCTVDPYTTIKELADLNIKGIKPKIIYHPLCQLILPFDVWYQWNNEENRKHGTVGTGFKACLDRVKAGYGITMLDATNPIILREKVRGVIDYYYKIISNVPTSFNLNSWVRVVNNYVKSVNLSFEIPSAQHYIFEGSQGILLDQRFGIMPFCTPSNTTSQNVFTLTNNKTFNIYYVMRPYITRHGNGPLCSDAEVINVIDVNNPYNEYQKTFRATKFSKSLLEHSLLIDSIFHKGLNINKILLFSHANNITEDLLSMNYNIKGFELETWLY